MQGRFGIRPRPPRDYQFLLGNMAIDNNPTLKRDVQMARDCYDDCIAFLDEELGRLLDELRGQGLLDNTVVIITSDHGEAFGDHGHFGHCFSLYLDVIGVPLVILSPARRRAGWWIVPSACATCPQPWSTSLGSRPAHRSRAARWRLTGGRHPGKMPRESPPQHFQSRPTRPRSSRSPEAATGTAGSRCPWWPRAIITFAMAWGPRSSTISTRDPSERVNLMGSPYGDQAVVVSFRRMLLEVLTENPGSIEVEEAYLEPYRQGLKALIQESSPQRVAAGRR